MTPSATLEEVEQLTTLLPPQDQLKLMARMSERLSNSLVIEGLSNQDAQEARLRLARQLLEECADVTEDAKGSSDSVETLRQLRDGRKA